MSSLECNPVSRLLKQRIASVAEYVSYQSHVNFLKASILKLLLSEEFVLSTGVEPTDSETWGDSDGDFIFEYSTSDEAYLKAFIRALQKFGPFPVEKVVISFDFQDTEDMKSVLQALFNSCTKIRSIHLAGKSVHHVSLSNLKCISKQLEELVLIDSFGSLTKDVFCVSLLGRPWIEYISSHDGRKSCLEPQFPALKHLRYQRQNSHQNWNDNFIKTAILTYYPNLKTLNWCVNDFHHNYALTKIPGLSGKQYNMESLLLTTVDLSDSHSSSPTHRMICNVDVGILPQIFPGLQDVSLVFTRGKDCQCSRSELRAPCESRASQVIETLTNVLCECSKVECLTASGDIVHLESVLHRVLSLHGHRIKSLSLWLHSTATTTQQHIFSIVSLCPNLENITVTGNGSFGGSLSESHRKCRWPKVKTLQFMLCDIPPENTKLMRVFLSACRYVENLNISAFSIESLCEVIGGHKADSVTILILPVLDDISDMDLDEHIRVMLQHYPGLRYIYVPRKVKRWRCLQQKLWNRGVTVKFTDLLAIGV